MISQHLCHLHDTIYDLFGKDLDDQPLQEIFDALPASILATIKEWGPGDTVANDYIWEYLKKNPPKSLTA